MQMSPEEVNSPSIESADLYLSVVAIILLGVL